MENISETLILYYETYFQNMVSVLEIDHVPDEILYLNPEINSEENDLFQSLGIIIVENSMAISFNVFNVLYPLCIAPILELKTKEKLTETEKITMNMASKIILCLNGEINTAFTARKRLLDEGFFKNLDEEMHFVEIICLKFKKSSIAWAYKLHLLEKIMKNSQEKEIIRDWEKEIAFITCYLMKHPRNYYAWSHRLLVLKTLLLKLNNDKKIGLLEKEVKIIKKYCEKNIHEYSAFHYLQFIIKKLLEENFIDLNEEKAWVIQLIVVYDECYEGSEIKTGKNERSISELFSLKKHLNFLEKL